MQTQFGVDTPDFGLPWKSRQFEFHNGLLGLPADLPIQPRLEGGLALLIGRKPKDRTSNTIQGQFATPTPRMDLTQFRLDDLGNWTFDGKPEATESHAFRFDITCEVRGHATLRISADRLDYSKSVSKAYGVCDPSIEVLVLEYGGNAMKSLELRPSRLRV